MASGALWRSCELVVRDGFVVWFGPSYYPGLAVVQRLCFDPDGVDAVVADVRSLVRARGIARAIWQIGPSAPARSDEALRAHGLIHGDDPTLGMLVLRREPSGMPSDIEVRPVETFEEFRTFLRVQRSAFEDEVEAPDLERAFALEHEDPNLVTYLAYIDGRAVATGRATFTPAGVALNGGGTLPDVRGRGAYRAIVGARWRAAVARGTPYLVTSARRATSYPILLRMGFEEIGEVRELVDEDF